MNSPSSVCTGVVAIASLMFGVSPILPAGAQDGEPAVNARIVIQAPDGEQVVELNNLQLPPSGESHAYIGSPDMVYLPGGDGFSADAASGAYSGLNIIDPGTSYLYALLKRIDVAQEIHLNARQREALDEAVTNQQTSRRQLLNEAVGGIRINLQSKNKEEMQAAFSEQAQRLREQTKRFADSRMRTVAAILKPEQMARLKELDLQFRGPMSMAVDEVAAGVSLDKDQKAGVASLLSRYRQEVRKSLGVGTQGIAFKPDSVPSSPVTSAPPADSEEKRVRLVKADKEIRKSRRELGAKALASLPDLQRAQWSKLRGKPFEFHPEL